jgi:hypothetical protein
MDALLNQRQAASLIGVSERTLECWRCRGGGPPFVKISRRALALPRRGAAVRQDLAARGALPTPGHRSVGGGAGAALDE